MADENNNGLGQAPVPVQRKDVEEAKAQAAQSSSGSGGGSGGGSGSGSKKAQRTEKQKAALEKARSARGSKRGAGASGGGPAGKLMELLFTDYPHVFIPGVLVAGVLLWARKTPQRVAEQLPADRMEARVPRAVRAVARQPDVDMHADEDCEAPVAKPPPQQPRHQPRRYPAGGLEETSHHGTQPDIANVTTGVPHRMVTFSDQPNVTRTVQFMV